MASFALRKATGGSTLRGGDILREDIPAQTVVIGQAVEDDQALAMVVDHTIVMGRAEEDDEALSISPRSVTPAPSTSRRRRRTVPSTAWTIGDREVPLEEWDASTAAHGGDNDLKGQLPEQLARSRRESIEPGAPIRGYDATGADIWGGEVVKPPSFSEGRAQILALGPMHDADESMRLLFLRRGPDGWQEATALGKESPNEHIRASIGEGEIVFEAENAIEGDSAGVVFWAEGATVRGVTYTRENVGSGSDYELEVKPFFGPSGADLSGSVDDTPGDAVIIRLVAGPLAGGSYKVTLTNVKVRDLAPSNESMSPSYGVKVIAGLLGWDTGGIDTGIPFTGASRTTVTGIPYLVDIATGFVAPPGTSPLQRGVRVQYYYRTETKNSSGLNVLPWDEDGPVKDSLDYFGGLVGFWGVGPELGPRGPLLKLGPFGPVRQIVAGAPSLDEQAQFNVVEVSYRVGGQAVLRGGGRSVGGSIGKVRLRADPDPFSGVVDARGRPITRVYRENLRGDQQDESFARQVASTLLPVVTRPRLVGVYDVLECDTGSIYHHRAGDISRISEWTDEAIELPVTATRMTPTGVQASTERLVSLEELFKLEEAEVARGPRAVIRELRGL